MTLQIINIILTFFMEFAAELYKRKTAAQVRSGIAERRVDVKQQHKKQRFGLYQLRRMTASRSFRKRIFS